MDHALRMDHHLDLLRCHTKEKLGLYDFQRLVHHGRGIYRNLAPHDPIGMSTGFFGRHMAQCRRIAGSKRPTRRCKDDLVYACRPIVWILWQRLKNGGMLAVNREQRGTAGSDRIHKKLSANNQGFLVRK